MSIKNLIHDTLIQEPNFRERARKDRGMATLLQQRYPVLATIPLETLRDAVQDYNSMDRAWRQCLEQNPHLRGKDYGDKENLEKSAQENLGYTVGKSFGEFSNLVKQQDSMENIEPIDETPKCCNEYYKSTSPVTFGPDPYASEINGDDTPVWECESCRSESSDDI